MQCPRANWVGQFDPLRGDTVAQLENYLGVKLLTRSTRGLTPTEAELGYFERARRAIEEADEAELAARGAGTGLKGRLRVCAAVTFARIHLIPLLPQFLAQHPDLDLEVVLDDRQIDLVQEGIDLALRMGRMLDSALTVRRIGRCKRLVLGTPGYFERAGSPERQPISASIRRSFICRAKAASGRSAPRQLWNLRSKSKAG